MQKKLGIWMATSLVVGNMIGSGIFLLPSALAPFGGVSLLGWIVSAIGALFIARVFGNVSRLLPGTSGGPYAYSRAGLGDFIGFLMGWGYWISVWATNAAIVVSLVSALSTFFPVLATSPVVAILTGLGFVWLLTWVNTMGIRAAGEMQLVTMILKIVPLAAIAVAGLFSIHWDHFVPFNLSDQSLPKAIASSATLTLFAFMGIECASIPAAQIEHPERTIPRATMLGTLFTTCLYILCTVAVMGVLSPKTLGRSVTPFADAAIVLWGPSARYWMAAGVALAAFGALNGWILVQGQIPMAIAQDRLFPAIFGKENKRGVPAASILFSTVLVSILMVMNYTKGLVAQFQFMLLLATLTSIIPFALVAASYVILVIRKGEAMSRRAWVKVLVPAGMAFIFSLLAVIGAGETIVYWGMVLLLIGVPLYVWNMYTRKSRP